MSVSECCISCTEMRGRLLLLLLLLLQFTGARSQQWSSCLSLNWTSWFRALGNLLVLWDSRTCKLQQTTMAYCRCNAGCHSAVRRSCATMPRCCWALWVDDVVCLWIHHTAAVAHSTSTDCFAAAQSQWFTSLKCFLFCAYAKFPGRRLSPKPLIMDCIFSEWDQHMALTIYRDA